MKTRVIWALLLPVLGCASADKVQTQAAGMTSAALCQKLGDSILASKARREIWVMELHRRGESCGRHGTVIQSRQPER